jgi:Ceramidase
MPISILKQFLFRSLLYTLAMFVIWFLLNLTLSGSIWAGMILTPAGINEYCEESVMNRFFHQLMNTYSNLAYFYFGLTVLQIAIHDRRIFNPSNRLSNFWQLSALLGACFVYLSFGSAFFHASLTWLGQRFDMNATYALTIAQIMIGLYMVLSAWRPSKLAKNGLILAIFILIIAFVEIHLRIKSSILLPAMIGLLLLLVLINYIQFRRERFLFLALLSFGCLIIAVFFRTIELTESKKFCDNHAFFQGHSFWHLFTGMSSFLNYTFFRLTKR